ncbi:hypothetical protein [Acuticoccus sp.]|uniref:hypothetical protein n=1 Tax=Acuticoccus sp. TaxID=1904378 RepID=UPI003B52433E
MMSERALSPSVSAYAPSAPTALAARPDLEEVALYLVAKLSQGSDPIGSGVAWRVYRDEVGADGERPLVTRSEGGDLDLRLSPGRYVVHASYGRAAVSRTLDLTRAVNVETLVLDAGGLQLAAVLDDPARPVSDDTQFELYGDEGGERRLLGTIRAGSIARLRAGTYHVVSRYGGLNAVRSADVKVEAGKLTRVSLRHAAGTVRLKLVRDAGGEALANTAWTVYGDDGEAVFERVGAHAALTLAEGRYEAVAQHRDITFRRTFTVRSGDEEDVTVLARQL